MTYDIVIGAMSDDQIYNYISDYVGSLQFLTTEFLNHSPSIDDAIMGGKAGELV